MQEPKTYRKKAVSSTVEAMQWLGASYMFKKWMGDCFDITLTGGAIIYVEANTSWLPIEFGEWVLKDEFGFYPNKRFEKDYELADGPTELERAENLLKSFQNGQRPGQAAMNVLRLTNSKLFNKVSGTELDPWDDQKRLNSFLEWLRSETNA